MTKVLVTGSRGLLGSSLVPHLRAHELTVISHGRSSDCDVCADLTDSQQVNAALDTARPDVIVNLAALTNVDECERYPQRAYLSNVRIVENLAAWIRDKGTSCHLVQLSTDQVYDGPGPHKENDILPSNYYAFSKYAGERVAASVRSTILRTNFFGRSDCASRKSFTDWLVQSLLEKRAMTVFDDVKFSPLSLACLVGMLALVIERRCEGTFNLGARSGMSKADFAFGLAEVAGLSAACMSRGTSNDVQLAAYRPKDMSMDPSLFEATFDIRLPSLKDELQSMKAAYANET